MTALIGSRKYPVLVCVRSVRYLDNLRVHLTFTDNTERDMDLEPYLHGLIFEPLRNDPKLFAQVYVDPESETLTWPNGADIAPETLYYNGEPPWVKEKRRVRSPRKTTTRRRITRPRAKRRKLSSARA
jgi:hypothetical protein